MIADASPRENIMKLFWQHFQQETWEDETFNKMKGQVPVRYRKQVNFVSNDSSCQFLFILVRNRCPIEYFNLAPTRRTVNEKAHWNWSKSILWLWLQQDDKEPKEMTILSNMYNVNEQEPPLAAFHQYYCFRGLPYKTFTYSMKGEICH